MRPVFKTIGTALLAAGLILVAACTQAPSVGATASKRSEAGMQQVTGTLSYRERLLLRPGAVAEVSLLDVSRADAPARTIARQLIDDPSAPPIPFVLKYDPAEIDQRMSYAVRAVIRQEDRLLFTTDTMYPVITRGAGNTVDLLLKRVGGPGPETKPDASLTNTYWKLVSVGGEMYRHVGANREPHLKLLERDNAVTGFGGCNGYSGRIELADGMLRFSDLAVTQRACLEGMEIESRFLAALREANRYAIRGDTLRLLRDDEDVLGFEAVYF